MTAQKKDDLLSAQFAIIVSVPVTREYVVDGFLASAYTGTAGTFLAALNTSRLVVDTLLASGDTVLVAPGTDMMKD